MDSKAPKSAADGIRTSHREIPSDADSAIHPSSSGRRPSQRPGENIMTSDDPSTAALRAWAADKQKQIPGSNGSFALGKMSMGAGAVSGGPVFLPRKEYIVEPPKSSVDRGPVELVKSEEEGGKKRKHSFLNLLRNSHSAQGKGQHKGEHKGLSEKVKDDVVR